MKMRSLHDCSRLRHNWKWPGKSEVLADDEEIRECKEGMTEDTTSLQMHYSFDYVQQVHFPSNPEQPGPACFLTARKCQLFRVACELLRTQVTYLIDEGETVGKGANATISLLHR